MSGSLISIWGWRSASRKLKSDGVAQTLLVTQGKAKPSLFKRATAVNDSRANWSCRSITTPCPIPSSKSGNSKERRTISGTGSADIRSSFALKTGRFMAALKFVRLLGLKIKIYSPQLDPQYSQGSWGDTGDNSSTGTPGSIDSTISLSSTGPHVGFPVRGWLDHQPDEEPAMNSPERQDAMSARDRGPSGVLQVPIARTTVGPWFRAATRIITVSSGTPGCSGSLLPDRGRARSVAWFRR
jgi:hypothetical protein